MRSWPAPHVPVVPGHGRALRLYDTALGQVMTAGGPARGTIYLCGFTPFDQPHLGHAATAIACDLVVRTWLDAGLEVTYVQNVADVDHRLFARAAERGLDGDELADEEVAEFALDMTSLGVIPPDHYIGVVEAIPVIARAVERMLDAGAAYRVPVPGGEGWAEHDLGDVYADLAADPRFGTVSRLSEAEGARLFAASGGEPDLEGKRHPLDPLLWRRERAGEPWWDGGPLGTGQPGVHIGCAAIVLEYLGGTCDVLGGGRDLVFPHHEMCESHLRVLAGQTHPVQRHVHAGIVAGHVTGHRISRPRDLVRIAQLLADEVPPMAIRLLVLAEHYRSAWEYSETALGRAKARLERWTAAVSGNGGPAVDAMVAELRDALADDLDSPRALRAVDSWADLALSYGQPGGLADDDVVEGAPGVAARAVDALLGVRL